MRKIIFHIRESMEVEKYSSQATTNFVTALAFCPREFVPNPAVYFEFIIIHPCNRVVICVKRF